MEDIIGWILAVPVVMLVFGYLLNIREKEGTGSMVIWIILAVLAVAFG